MSIQKFAILAVCCFSTVLSLKNQKIHDDFGLNVYELIDKHGFTYETHEVITEDGYILCMQRITGRKTRTLKNENNKPAILLMHGLLSSAADWVNVGPERSLAYKLSDLGFDVWLGNARGTTLSRKHITLDPDIDAKQFYNYTWTEIGYFDLPAKIDYILESTGQERLQYVGFSQGTTSFFAMASDRPEYNDKIKLASTLAPVAEMKYFKNPIFKVVAKFENILDSLFQGLKIHELLRYGEIFKVFGKELCDDGKPTQELCKILLFAIAGYNREQLAGDFIPVIVSNAPGGCSARQLTHYLQIINNDGVMRKYSYANDNPNAPELPEAYDLSKITAPLALYYSENDWLSSEVDVQSMIAQMPNVVHQQLSKHLNHIDYQWAIDVVDLVFNDVIQLIVQYK